MSTSKQKQFIDVAFILGSGLLCLLFLTISITAIAFLFHGRVSRIWLLLSLLLSLGYIYYALKRKQISAKPVWLLLFLAFLGGSVLFSSLSLDTSYDGNAYHKVAVGELKNGWNPIWQSVEAFNASPANPVKLDDTQGIWVNHYAKAHWIFGATIYKLTGNIESGKSMLPLTMIALFLLALAYFRVRFTLTMSLALSLLIACNPIAIAQIFTYLNDGIIGNLVITLILLLTLLIDKKSREYSSVKLIYINLFMVFVLLINIKFTGLAYAGIYALCYFGFLSLRFRQNLHTIKMFTLVGASALVFGITVVGASSYLVNVFHEHNPLYPLMGTGKQDIMTGNEPKSYVAKNRFIKFFESNFSYTENMNVQQNGTFKPAEPKLKVPFAISSSELNKYGDVDIRQAGYGVWFGGALILSTLVGVYLLVNYRKQYRSALPFFLLPLLGIAIAIICFNDLWWARYLPQLYVYPIIIVAALLCVRLKWVAYLIIIILCFNIILLGALQVKNEKAFRADNLYGFSIYLQCNRQMLVYTGPFSGAAYNFTDRCKRVTILTTDAYNQYNQHNFYSTYQESRIYKY